MEELDREMALRLDRFREEERERLAAEAREREAAAASVRSTPGEVEAEAHQPPAEVGGAPPPASAGVDDVDELDRLVAARLDQCLCEEAPKTQELPDDAGQGEAAGELSPATRLHERGRSAAARRQAIALYALAGIVAFVAVVGAWWTAAHLLDDEEVVRAPGYLTLLTLTAPDSGKPVAAALVVRDEAAPRYALYVVPRELLLEGPGGEYVFAGDSMATGNLRGDLERVIGATIDAEYTLPLTALAELAGADVLQVNLDRPVTIAKDGRERTFEDIMVIVNDDIPFLFTTSGSGGYDSTTIQEGLWTAVLAAAAGQSPAPSPAKDSVLAAASGTADRWYLEDALAGLTAGNANVARVPSRSRVAEGQFAFLPDATGIMADITRRRGNFASQYTVAVRNGSGKVGIGAEVVAALSALDVNLPDPINADRFDYRQTRILAGSGALAVAEDVRAILGRGVVLNGAGVPANTVVVIVGNDLRSQDLKPKDQP